MRPDFIINNEIILAGTRQTINIPLSRLADHSRTVMKAHVIHGRSDGPVMFVSAAIHGDEIIGVEIIRRLMSLKMIDRLKGTLILIPVVNPYGFINLSRYLPDRRDLNRCFPGHENGSMAAQLAHTFMTEIVLKSSYGLDLHSAAIHRDNLPQIRANLDDPDVKALAEAFGASVLLNANLRDGSLREAAQESGCKMLLYEAGEALRFDELAVRIGVKGVIGVMRHISMLNVKKGNRVKADLLFSKSSHWLRSPCSGVTRSQKPLGASVKKGEVVAIVSDPLGGEQQEIVAKRSGVIIGRSNLPIVNRGDALFHIAIVNKFKDADDVLDMIEMHAENDPLFDDADFV